MAKKKEIKKTEKTEEVKINRQQLSGVVMSDKMKDTVVVKVQSYKKHPKYQKFISRSKRFKAHDAGNTCKVGDKVTIEACAPISKDKRFKVVK